MPAKIEHLRRLAAAGDSDARSALERWDRRTGRDDGLAECAERLLGSVDDLLAELVEMSLEWQPFWARIKEVECLLDAERARIRSASRRRQGDDDGSVEPSPALDGQAHEPQPDEVPGDDRGLHSRSRYPIRSVCPLTRAGAALKRADEVHTLMVYIGRKLPVCEAEERNVAVALDELAYCARRPVAGALHERALSLAAGSSYSDIPAPNVYFDPCPSMFGRVMDDSPAANPELLLPVRAIRWRDRLPPLTPD